jgi:hypothetical protein
MLTGKRYREDSNHLNRYIKAWQTSTLPKKQFKRLFHRNLKYNNLCLIASLMDFKTRIAPLDFTPPNQKTIQGYLFIFHLSSNNGIVSVKIKTKNMIGIFH